MFLSSEAGERRNQQARNSGALVVFDHYLFPFVSGFGKERDPLERLIRQRNVSALTCGIIDHYGTRTLCQANSCMVHRPAARADVPLGERGIMRELFETKRNLVYFAYRSSAQYYQG